MGNVTKVDTHKLFKQIFVSMIVTEFHFFKIHRKMIFGNSAVIVQNMFRITPKSFNAINMILAVVGKRFAVVQSVVFAQTLQGVVAAESIGVVHRPLSRVGLDMGHQFVGRDLLHYFSVDPSIALQKAKNNAFSRRSAATLALSPAAKVGLVNLYLAFQLARLQFSDMIDRFAQMLIHAGHRLIIYAEIGSHAVGRLLLVEAGQDGNLAPQMFQRFLFSTGLFSTAHISTLRFTDSKRTAKNTLSTSQKVGRTIENVLFLHNQAILYHRLGYETH